MMKNQKNIGTNINITGSSIGMLNTGEIKDIQSISVNVDSLKQSGQTDVASALIALTEAIASSQEIDTSQRNDLLDQIEELSKQATLPPEKRAKIGIIKSLTAGIATGLAAAGGLAEVWSTWGPAIRTYFGI